MSALILEYALTYAQIAMVLALGLACWRMLRGPRAQDRVLGLDTMYMCAMLLLVVALVSLERWARRRQRYSVSGQRAQYSSSVAITWVVHACTQA